VCIFSLLAAPAEQEVMIGGFSLPETQLVDQMRLSGTGQDAEFRDAARTLHAAQLAQVRVLAQNGAQIVSLQEGAGMGFAEDVEALLTEAAVVAREEGIYLVLPTATLPPAGKDLMKNVVYIIDPQGEIVLEHYKYGGAQFEGFVMGSGELQTVETPYGLLSAVICWDADFPQIIKQVGEQGVDLLFVPSNDWLELRDIHSGMATFRAVENGVSIYRQAGGGVSVVTDAYGRVLNRVDIFEEDGQPAWGGIQLVQTPLGSVETAYVQVGDAFGILMLVGMLGLLVVAWWKRKQE
jgi:apolipoprotein N-acyltransferase